MMTKNVGLFFVGDLPQGGYAATLGGTKEFYAPASNGVDLNAALHFQVMSNELITPLLLICPHEKSRTPAESFESLKPDNITYQLHTQAQVEVVYQERSLTLPRR